MDKVLRPERFCTDPSSVGASKSWIHQRRTFENFSRCSGSEFPPTSYRQRCSNMWRSVPTTNLRSQLSVIFTSNQQMKSTQDTSSLQDVNKRVKAWTSTYRLSKFSARNVTSNLSRLPCCCSDNKLYIIVFVKHSSCRQCYILLGCLYCARKHL